VSRCWCKSCKTWCDHWWDRSHCSWSIYIMFTC